MSLFSKHLFAALMGVALLSSCSRPVAYFQPSHTERFTSPKAETVAVIAPLETTQSTEKSAPVTVTVEETTPAISGPAPVVPITEAKVAVEKLDAYVRNDTKLAGSRKLSKRMDHLKEMLAATGAKPSLATNTTASVKKMTFVERVAVKRLNNRIKDTLSPERPMAKSVLTIGLIIAVIGLILILVGVAAPLGSIALIVGLVLVLLGLLGVV